ncbi:TPA_asm: hypothetical protein G0G78_22985 [Salmonella enterica]|nr:hypothetical protein [Salmonella enterica]EAO7617982.1 hypothetical protein [Salmonella enterica]EAQ6818721.1 hypothetical protein [Salmonella enterica]EAU9426431.1 hypothetical protein [Salmonella enterica]EBQ2130605.1 hypothetical protein [Salmonella enterica]
MAKVKTKYGLDHIGWHGGTFFNHGVKITTSSPEQFVIALPAWQRSGVNNYTLDGIASHQAGCVSHERYRKR